MQRRLLLLAVMIMFIMLPDASRSAEALRLATGSPYELGLVDALFDEFKKDIPCELTVTQAGSGASLKLLKEGSVDVVMVHAPAAEEAAVKEGWALHRTYIGANDFVIAGPKSDPAKINNCNSIVCAYQKIAQKGAPFVSRGDNSGTNKKELAIWKQVGCCAQRWMVHCYKGLHDGFTA